MARGDYPSAKQDQFMVRFPDGMRDRLKEAAADSGRSMNAEIVQRLEDSLDGGLVAKIADAAFLKGMMIGFVETLLLEDDPLAALHEQRERLMKPMTVKSILSED